MLQCSKYIKDDRTTGDHVLLLSLKLTPPPPSLVRMATSLSYRLVFIISV
jgi:hypothetical protein